MKINFLSFRFRIILTLVVITSLFSSVAFYFYSQFLLDRVYSTAEQNIVNVISFLRDEIIDIHDGAMIKPLMSKAGSAGGVINTYLLDKDGHVIYPVLGEFDEFDTTHLHKLMNSREDVSVQTLRSRKNPISRAFLHINNQPSCFKCHSPQQSTLGYIALDISLQEPKSNLTFMRLSSIMFTVAIVIMIMTFVMVLHYRFIRKSLGRFQEAISEINEGNLGTRVEIKETSELAELGKDFNKMVNNFQWTQQELTQIHQKEIENTEKLAAIGEMAARLAHDVKNPLTGIANSIEIISEDMKDSENLPILAEIRRQTQRVNTAISNLLKFSRSAEINKSKGNINDLLNSLVFFLRSQRQNRKVEFHLTVDRDVPSFHYDAEQIENVLMNVCLNAVQAIKREGVITISTTNDKVNKEVIISIQDNGPGIPPQISHEIFTPFYTTRTEGTGLGLAIAKDIMDKHGGRIWFEDAPEGGTIFYLALPAANGTMEV